MRLTTCLLLASLAAPAFADPATVTVAGHGEVSLPPDMARICVGVSARADTAGEAMAQMNSAARAVLDSLLTDEGLDSADVQTGQLTLGPVLDYQNADGGQVVGFTASTTVDIVVRDLTRLGGLLDSVVGDGANTLDRLSFDLADPSAALDEARRMAVADAHARAALYAEAAGVGLGPVMSISDVGSGGEPAPMMMMAEARGVPIAEGSVSVSATVNMVYELTQ